MLLPVKGLRHDGDGELTADAVKIVTDGMANLGISIDKEDSQTAILMEAKQVLCNLNTQYEFLLTTLFTSIRNSEPLSKSLLDSITEKNMAMRDIISVSRQILQGASKDGGKFIEGFVVNSENPVNSANKKTLEGFQTMADNLGSDQAALNSQQYSEIKRNFDISVENNRGISTNLTLYSFLNIVAVGLLFYIVSAK